LGKYPNYYLILFLKFHELKLETVNDIYLPGCRADGRFKEEISKYQNSAYDKVLVLERIPRKKKRGAFSSGICLAYF